MLTKQYRQTVLQRRYRSQGYFADPACVIVWRPSFIPYFIELWVQCNAEKWDYICLVPVTAAYLDYEPVSPFLTKRVWYLIFCRSFGKTQSSAE